jgi:hypothetical protein
MKEMLKIHVFMANYVATLALGLRPRQGLAKVWAKSEVQESHFMLPGGWEYGRVGKIEPAHSQINSHFGSWSPNGFPNLQRAIVGVKTHCIEEFAWPIWTSEIKVMAKRRVDNQIGNLTINH